MLSGREKGHTNNLKNKGAASERGNVSEGWNKKVGESRREASEEQGKLDSKGRQARHNREKLRRHRGKAKHVNKTKGNRNQPLGEFSTERKAGSHRKCNILHRGEMADVHTAMNTKRKTCYEVC